MNLGFVMSLHGQNYNWHLGEVSQHYEVYPCCFYFPKKKHQYNAHKNYGNVFQNKNKSEINLLREAGLCRKGILQLISKLRCTLGRNIQTLANLK